MTITQISAWIMLVSCGLWAGGILIFAVERTNLWRRMPIEQYAVAFRRSLFRVDPMMPILGAIAGAAATIFALQRSGAASGLAWTPPAKNPSGPPDSKSEAPPACTGRPSVRPGSIS
jgi:hypothetical protein